MYNTQQVLWAESFLGGGGGKGIVMASLSSLKGEREGTWIDTEVVKQSVDRGGATGLRLLLGGSP